LIMKHLTESIIFLLTGLLIILCVAPAAGASETSRGGSFLPMGWDARGEGLAGAATLLIRDDRSAYWNPANLTFLPSVGISVGTTEPIPDLDNRYSFVSIGTGLLDTRQNTSAGITMKRFGAALTVSHMGLTLAGGSKWGESTIGLSAAFAPNSFNSIGCTAKVLQNRTDLANADASGLAIDIGWTALLYKYIYFGFMARNVYNKISYPERDDKIDAMYNIAIGYDDASKPISAEVDAVLKRYWLNRILAGMEVTVVENVLSLIGGMDYRLTEGKRSIYHIGISTAYNTFEISLSFKFDPEDAFGRQTFVSLSYRM